MYLCIMEMKKHGRPNYESDYCARKRLAQCLSFFLIRKWCATKVFWLMASAPRPIVLILFFILQFLNSSFRIFVGQQTSTLADHFRWLFVLFWAGLTPVVTGKTRRARGLRKQDPWTAVIFRLDAHVRIEQLWSYFLHFIVLILP